MSIKLGKKKELLKLLDSDGIELNVSYDYEPYIPEFKKKRRKKTKYIHRENIKFSLNFLETLFEEDF